MRCNSYQLNTFIACVLVHLGCCNKIPQTRRLKRQKFISHSPWRLGFWDQRAGMVHSWWGPSSGYVLTWPQLVNEQREIEATDQCCISSSFYKGINSIMTTSPSSPSSLNYLLKVTLPYTIILRITIWVEHWQSIAVWRMRDLKKLNIFWGQDKENCPSHATWGFVSDISTKY